MRIRILVGGMSVLLVRRFDMIVRHTSQARNVAAPQAELLARLAAPGSTMRRAAWGAKAGGMGSSRLVREAGSPPQAPRFCGPV